MNADPDLTTSRKYVTCDKCGGNASLDDPVCEECDGWGKVQLERTCGECDQRPAYTGGRCVSCAAHDLGAES